MVFQKKSEMKLYRAIVNLSVGRVERGPNGREERAERVERGNTVELTDEEAANLGRLVRLVETEENDKVPTRVSAKQILGIGEVDKRGTSLQGSGALDMRNETRVMLTEAEADEAAQPTKNPVDPSYRPDEDDK